MGQSILCLCLSGGAAWAEIGVPPSDNSATQNENPSFDQGFDLLDQGARIILRSLLEQAEPAMDELQAAMDEVLTKFGPALRDLAAMIDDVNNYEKPEMLPNGDIIIRRKSPMQRDDQPPGSEIEL